MKLCAVLLEPVGRVSFRESKTTLVRKMQIVWKDFIATKVSATCVVDRWPRFRLVASTGGGDAFSEGNADELPVHNVCVSAFEMDVHEVTNAE